MNILALDTSNRPLSVALIQDNQILATTTTTVHLKHAQYVLPIMQDLMKHAEMDPQDLDRIVVADGPGSYTGIRVAASVGKVLAATLGIELVGVSSLQALSLNVQNEGQLVNPVFDARNQNIFTGLYQIKSGLPKVVIKDQHISVNEWRTKLHHFKASIIGLGDADHFTNLLDIDQYVTQLGMNNLPQAGNLGLFGQHCQPVADIDRFVPRYLRLTQAEADWQAQHPGEDSSSYVRKV